MVTGTDRPGYHCQFCQNINKTVFTACGSGHLGKSVKTVYFTKNSGFAVNMAILGVIAGTSYETR